MWIADALAAFIIGVLSGMGVGGGGLFVIYLTLIKGVAQIEAQGLNLYFFLIASGAALFVHMVKRSINYRLVFTLAALGIPSAVLGSILATRVHPEAVRLIFGLMLIVAGGISLFTTSKSILKIKKK
ncbi:MAG: TSUP family transporter [Clostridia bacterium]|nr:TSUP family transporter [Clostridia bacterium]